MMKATLWQRLDATARRSLPIAFCLLLVMASLLPYRLPFATSVMPMLALLAVAHWTLYRPDLMPIWAAFGIGLFQDMLSGGTFGVCALQFVLIRSAVSVQQRFLLGRSFIVVWWAQGMLVLAAALFAWGLASLLAWHVLDVIAPLVQGTLTAALYPVLGLLMLRTQRALLAQV